MLIGVVSFLLASCIRRVLCALQNVSIDDTNGDQMTKQQITYSPASQWSFGPTCKDCEAKVEPSSEPFDQTWRDTSFIKGGPLISASATFTGMLLIFCPIVRFERANVAALRFSSVRSLHPDRDLLKSQRKFGYGIFSRRRSSGKLSTRAQRQSSLSIQLRGLLQRFVADGIT